MVEITRSFDDMQSENMLLSVQVEEQIWLVVWTPLKNISQLGWLFPMYGKIKNVPNHQPEMHIYNMEAPVGISNHMRFLG